MSRTIAMAKPPSSPLSFEMVISTGNSSPFRHCHQLAAGAHQLARSVTFHEALAVDPVSSSESGREEHYERSTCHLRP